MEITINYYGPAVSASVEVYKYLTQADHKTENLAHNSNVCLSIRRGLLRSPSAMGVAPRQKVTPASRLSLSGGANIHHRKVTM